MADRVVSRRLATMLAAPVLALLVVCSAGVTSAAAATSLTLTGTVRGTYLSSSVPAGPSVYTLSGQGRVNTRRTRVGGSITSVGFVATGRATGSVTLHTAVGSMTLSLWGPTQNGLSPLPSQFTWGLTAGTGRFAHRTGSGTLDLALTAATPSSGTFTLAFV